jgi:hypothetical protein
MVYFKVVLDNRKPKESGIYSIVIRLTFNRKMTTISTGICVLEQQWNDKTSQVPPSHPNYQLLNKNVTEFYLKVQKASFQLEDESLFSFEALKERLDDAYKDLLFPSSKSLKTSQASLLAT